MIRKRYGYWIVCWLLSLMSAYAQTTTYPLQVNANVVPPYSLYLSDYYSGTRDRLSITLINRDQLTPTVNVRLRMIITAAGGIRIQTNENSFIQPLVVEAGSPVRLTQEDLAPYFQPDNIITQGFLSAGKMPEGMVEFCFQAIEAYTGRVLSTSTCTRAWITSQKPPLLSLPRNDESIAFREPLNVLFQWTPLHQGLAQVEYDFILKELWDNGMTVQAAFPYSPEIYRETTRSTSIVYGALQPPLLPGKRYAWCVQAKARDGMEELNVFQNNGYSEIRWFRLQDNCQPLELVEATAERKRVTLAWTPLPEHIGFTINYREKSKTDQQNEWKESSTQQTQTTLYGLKAGAIYEYRVGSVCMSGQPIYTPIMEVLVPAADSARTAQCGLLPAVNLQNQELIGELKPQEVFHVGDFPVTVVRCSGGKGSLTGVGWTIIPWLNDAKMAVEFNSIAVNTDRQMTQGVVRAIYDEKAGQIANLDDAFVGGFDQGLVKTGLTKTDTTFDFSIPGVESFALGDDGSLIITDAGGEPHSIAMSDKEGEGNEGNKVKVFPMTVKDKDGNVYQVEKVTETEDGQEKETVKATKLGNIGAALAADSFDPTQLNADKAIVRFNKGTGKYSFDTWQSYYANILLIRDKYEKLHNNYYAAWKLLPGGENDDVGATIEIVDKTIDPTKVIFTTPQGTRYDATHNNGTYSLRVTSGPEGDVQELYALYPRSADKYYTLGKLSIATYAKQEREVVLVSVDNTHVDYEEVEEMLKSVYDSVGIHWTISRDAFSYNATGLMANATGLSTYNDAMRALNNAYRAARPGFKSSANYVFFLKATGNTDVNNRDLTGFMPRGSQFGYIFTSEVANVYEPITVAHELGHGRWKLYHPFDKTYGGFESAKKTSNLMAYGNGGHIAKWQWDQLADPAAVVSVFERDDRSQAQTDPNPVLAQVKQRMRELEAATNLKFFSIIHCDVCKEQTQNATTQIISSEPVSVPTQVLNDGKTLTGLVGVSLSKIQTIESVPSDGSPGGKCVVLYYSRAAGVSLNVAAASASDPFQFDIYKPQGRNELFFLSTTNSANCTDYIGTWSSGLCSLKVDKLSESATTATSYFNGLFDAINTCLLKTPMPGKVLVNSEIEQLLVKAQSEARSTQRFEFVQRGFVFGLNAQNKLEQIANPQSDAAINAGNLGDPSLEMKMRLGFDEQGILQFAALGIKKDLTLAPGKTADLPSIADNMRLKNNALFKEAKVTDVGNTPRVKPSPTIINSDEFPDRKKISVDLDASYLKLACELGGVAVTFLKTTKIEQPVYTESGVHTIKGPPIATGTLESVGMVVTDITSAVASIHDLVTDKEARKAAIEGFGQVKDQVVDDPTQLFPILKEVVLEEFTGSTSEEFTEMMATGTDEGRREHVIAKTSVKTASSVFSSGKFIVRLPEMAQEVSFKMAKTKSYLKFRKLKDIPADVFTAFENRLARLADGGKQFLADVKDVSDDIRRKFLTRQGLIDAWETVADHVNIRKHVTSLEKISDLLNDSDFMGKLPNGRADLDAIIDAAKNPLDGGTASKLATLADHLENVRMVVKNHSGVDGFSKLMTDLKNPAFAMQDGVTHMLGDVKKFPKGRVKKFDYEFDGDDVACTKCRFDVEMAGTPPEFREYKSWSLDNIPNISTKQMIEYFRTVESLDNMKYVFNSLKTPDLSLIKGKFKEMFGRKETAEAIFKSLGEAKFKKTFGVDNVDDFIDDVVPVMEGPKSIYRFITISE